MKLRIVIAALLMTGMALMPASASAKGVTQVRVSGPDLVQPINFGAEGAGNVAQATGLYSAFFDTTPPSPDPRLLSEDLGKPYTATYTYAVPEQRTERQGIVRQELYPYAAGGAVTYTPAGQRLFNATSRGTWHRDARLASILIAAGLPAPAPAPSQAVSTAVDATPRLTG